jgi:hypothetical protein
MSATFTDIVTYFRTLAEQHIEIGHSAAEKHFYRYELEEVLGGLNQMNYPALILEGYRYGFRDNKSDNVLKERTGAFILLGHVKDLGDYDAIHELLDKLETISDDIFARIKSDKRNPAVAAVRDFDLNSVDAALILNEHDKNYGIRFNFTIVSPRPMDVDPDKWNFPE